MNILYKTIKETFQMLDQKKISSVELTRMVFERVKQVEPKLETTEFFSNSRWGKFRS